MRRAAGTGLLILLAGCGPGPLDVPAVIRGHVEVQVGTDGRVIPVALDPARPLGLCLEVDSATDTSRWEARLDLDGEPSPSGFAPPVARTGRTLCFDGKLPGTADGRHRLCGLLVDRFDGSERRLPCREVIVGGDSRTREALDSEARSLLEERAGMPVGAFLNRLDRLDARARDAGLPLMSLRFALVGVHFLTREGTPAALAEAVRRVERLPDWLEREEVSRVAGQAAYNRAELEVARGELAAAWQSFAEAQRRYARVADPARFTVTVQQADLLAQAGAAREAVDRLRADLAECGRQPCDQRLLPYGRLQLAWLVLLDPDASGTELREAAAGLTSALREIEPDPVEEANQLVNLAYLRVRLGEDPASELARARRNLAAASGELPPLLLGWADLVEGMSRPERALELCGRLAERSDPRLAARALSCLGEARRRSGDLAGADQAFSQALLRHEHGDARAIGLVLPLGSGQRADDYAHAARVAVERGDPARAWELLASLDRLSANEGERRRCRERAAGPALRRWEEIDSESEALQEQLAALAGPASEERRRLSEATRRDLQARLRELWREWPGCAGAAPGDDEGVRFRAVALEDEVLLLGRDAGGVAVERRTRLPRERVRELVEEIGRALDRRDLDDEAWRRLAAPLAQALLPRQVSGEVETWAVHGLLQGVPLSALPLGKGWLSDRVTVALQPAGARAGSGHAGEPLFVIDPLGDLAGGSELVPFYRDLFPGARVLHRDEAAREPFRRALDRAAWLHLDTHGSFEPAFPELSSLELADGPLRMVQLAGFPVPGRFANLSGCATGRWPITADSGRYGIGGLLARLGVGWVIASRTDLPDALARDFNRAFYRSIRAGRTVPAAHREALIEVRRGHPAVAWAGLLLLRGAGAGEGNLLPSPLPT